jgi:hypothetical protein
LQKARKQVSPIQLLTAKLSIYSYSNDINTCKCQAGYDPQLLQKARKQVSPIQLLIVLCYLLVKLSIYSYSNDINTCKCQAGYEFSLSASGEELSKKGKQENSFTSPLDLAGKKLQCVIPKDNTKLSTAVQ